MTIALPSPVRAAGTVLAALALVARPATSGSAAGTYRPARTASAWLPWWGGEAVLEDALRHASQLHTVSPFWYEASSDTAIGGCSGAGDRRTVDRLHEKRTGVVPTVIETPDATAMAELLSDPARRAAHVDARMGIAGSAGYDGLDLDDEGMAETGDEGLRERARIGVDRVLTGARTGSIVLNHDGCLTPGFVPAPGGPADRSQTAEAVHRYLPRLRTAGYRFTVPGDS
ncbi:hypothetical protein ACFWIQ_20340 [Kitasatospora sp. NPDC127059]|uniref:hypothetical protein n=1 Tax=unclassified Kitasatospora TaxID=2633591 RepID=UPI003666A71D